MRDEGNRSSDFIVGYLPTVGLMSLRSSLPKPLRLQQDSVYQASVGGNVFWTKFANVLRPSLPKIENAISECDVLVVGPLADQNDFRLRVARKHKIPVIMLWDKTWPQPKCVQADALFSDYHDIQSLDDLVRSLASERHTDTTPVTARNEADNPPPSGEDLLAALGVRGE